MQSTSQVVPRSGEESTQKNAQGLVGFSIAIFENVQTVSEKYDHSITLRLSAAAIGGACSMALGSSYIFDANARRKNAAKNKYSFAVH